MGLAHPFTTIFLPCLQSSICQGQPWAYSTRWDFVTILSATIFSPPLFSAHPAHLAGLLGDNFGGKQPPSVELCPSPVAPCEVTGSGCGGYFDKWVTYFALLALTPLNLQGHKPRIDNGSYQLKQFLFSQGILLHLVNQSPTYLLWNVWFGDP